MTLPSSPTAFTLADAREAVRAKKISSRELTQAFVTAIAGPRSLNAFVTDVIDEDADKCCRTFFAALGPSGLCVAEALTCRDCGTQFTPSTVGPNRHWRIVPRTSTDH